MKNGIKILLLSLFLSLGLSIRSQDNVSVPQRTPEQEAAKQTEKIQQELNLTSEQIKQVYEINLRYARERQVSNTRSQAMERIKNKNTEMQRILTENQYNQLQSKRYERTSIENQNVNRNQSNASGFRSSTDYRTNSAVRVISSDMNLRSSYRSAPPTNSSAPQATLRSDQSNQRSSQSNNGTSRPQSVAPSSTRSSSPASTRSSSPPSRSSTTPSANSSRR
ncbi:MAG TPA: hypothetical protein VFC36_08050 [Paludibacter sp.]|nr:hypothetical protein [Paludibacter sp.]